MKSNGDARVVVIGGGVVGSACALRLQQAGFSTLLLDAPSTRRPASYGNAGHIAIEQVVPLASPEALRSAPGRLFVRGGALDFRLGDIATWAPWAMTYLGRSSAAQARHGQAVLTDLLRAALPAWRRLSAELDPAGLLVEGGHMVVWESTRTAAAGRRAWSGLDIGEASLRDLSSLEAEAVKRQVRAGLAGGMAFDHTGKVADPVMLMAALEHAHDAAGGTRRSARVASLGALDGKAQVVLEGGERLAPQLVVLAGGVGSGPLMRRLGHPAPVIAERGYHIEGPAGTVDGWDWTLPPIVFEDRSLIVNRFGGRLRASSFVEFGREDSPPDPRKFARLRKHVAELGLPMQEPITEWMGARPTLPDYLPAIGRSRRVANLIYAFGHQHLGLTLAPITGEMVTAIAREHTPEVALAPFDLDRFAKRPNGGAH